MLRSNRRGQSQLSFPISNSGAAILTSSSDACESAFRFRVDKDWGKVEALYPNHVWQSDMTKVWAGPVWVGRIWSR